MRTLDARLKRHEASTLEIARKLQAHPKVKRVLYPALESDPGHAIWKRDYLGATGLFGAELIDCAAEKLAAFVDSLECFALGYSWGGFDSLVVPQNISKARSVRPWTGGRSSGSPLASRIREISTTISRWGWREFHETTSLPFARRGPGRRLVGSRHARAGKVAADPPWHRGRPPAAQEQQVHVARADRE